FFAVVLRTRSKCHATGTPDRATSGTSTGTTATFLTPRLATATFYFGASLLLHSTLTSTSQIGYDGLVNQSFVKFFAKSLVRNRDCTGRLAARFYEIQFH